MVTFKKNLLFSFVILALLLLFFEFTLYLGGYFYFYVYSNLDNPNIDECAFRILYLGESTTIGGEAGGLKVAYPAQIEKILQQKYPDIKVESYNKGIGGATTATILKNIDRNMIKYKPHLVILMTGGNDGFVSDTGIAAARREPFYYLSRVYHLLALASDVFKYKFFYVSSGDFRFIGRAPRFESLSVVGHNFNSIIKKAESYNSEVYLAGYIHPNARERLNPALKKIAEDNSILFIEGYPIIDYEANHSLFAWDGVHPSEEGHKVITEVISQAIIKEDIVRGPGHDCLI